MSIPAKRACDACHRRKVRCNSRQPCVNCSQAGLSCTYDAIPQKKGPKGSRAKVISELRETQKLSDLAQEVRNYASPPRSPTYARTANLLTKELIESCTEYFFQQMYPTMPILYREQVQQAAMETGYSVDAYCLITSLCAFMLIQPGIVLKTSSFIDAPTGPITNPKLGTVLMEEAVRVRKGYDYIESPTIVTCITSFFLFASCCALNKHNSGWFHLREATALAQILGMQDESTYAFESSIETSRKRRLFWLLFVTERAYALQKHRPLTLQPAIGLPTVDSNSPNSLTGFVHMVNLYRPIDDTFIGLWNKSRTDCSPFTLARLQQQLTEALPQVLTTTQSQAADLRTSQQWLRTLVWQLSIANGFLSSTSPDTSMTFRFPIEIAKDLVAVTSQFSKQSMEAHGIGLIEKLFDVACTLIDVMSCVPLTTTTTPTTSSPRPYEAQQPQTLLAALLTLISTLRGGESRYLPLIMVKIRDTLPSILKALPQELACKMVLRAERGGGGGGSGESSVDSSPYSTPPFWGGYSMT